MKLWFMLLVLLYVGCETEIVMGDVNPPAQSEITEDTTQVLSRPTMLIGELEETETLVEEVMSSYEWPSSTGMAVIEEVSSSSAEPQDSVVARVTKLTSYYKPDSLLSNCDVIDTPAVAKFDQEGKFRLSGNFACYTVDLVVTAVIPGEIADDGSQMFYGFDKSVNGINIQMFADGKILFWYNSCSVYDVMRCDRDLNRVKYLLE